MDEPKENIRLLHPECAPRPKIELAAKGGDYFIGKAVKRRFGREHMWVRVDNVKGKILTGILDNDPLVSGGLKRGDRVQVRLSQIEDVAE